MYWKHCDAANICQGKSMQYNKTVLKRLIKRPRFENISFLPNWRNESQSYFFSQFQTYGNIWTNLFSFNIMMQAVNSHMSFWSWTTKYYLKNRTHIFFFEVETKINYVQFVSHTKVHLKIYSVWKVTLTSSMQRCMQ